MYDSLIWIGGLIAMYWIGYHIGYEDATTEDMLQMETNLKDNFTKILNKSTTVDKTAKWN